MTTSVEEEAPARRVTADTPVVVRPRTRPWRQRLRLPLMILGPALVLIAAGWWYLTTGRYVSTDDAYVQAARTSISTDVSGRVVAIDVHDNERVAAGHVLFRLDDRPFMIAVADAKAELAAAALQVQALQATYRQKTAEEKAAEDTLAYQASQLAREKRLLATGIASQSQFDQVENAYQVAQQNVISNQHDIGNTLAQLGGDVDLRIDLHPSVERARAMLDQAELNLSYTVIHAPESGIVTKVDQLQVGDYVTTSTPVFSLMSDRIWVEANYKETELTHMRVGDRATVEVDTYPDTVFQARVESFSPGTGLTFALLPPENATGNWVKVVQRLPVRLTFDNIDPNTPLRAGLSADVDVDTHYRRPWLVGLDRALDRLFGWHLAPRAEAGAAR
jgi:membrane fusion protein (multidrug efflux system)